MENTTFANSVSREPITLESMMKAIEAIGERPRPKNLLIMCNRKQNKEIENLPSAELLFFGTPVRIIVKPYIKKIRIINLEPFSWILPEGLL